jgi:hypothetical protein
MAVRTRTRWWVGGLVVLGLSLIAFGRFLVGRGLEDADRWASVLGLFLNVAAVLLTAYSTVVDRRAPSGRTRSEPVEPTGGPPTGAEAGDGAASGRVPAATEPDRPPVPGARRPPVPVPVAAGALALALVGGAIALATRHGPDQATGGAASGGADPPTASPRVGISRVPPRAGPVGTPYLVPGSEVALDGTSGRGCRAWMNGSDPGPYVQGVVTSSGDDSLARICLTDHATGRSVCGGAFGGASPVAGSRPPGPGA